MNDLSCKRRHVSSISSMYPITAVGQQNGDDHVQFKLRSRDDVCANYGTGETAIPNPRITQITTVVAIRISLGGM